MSSLAPKPNGDEEKKPHPGCGIHPCYEKPKFTAPRHPGPPKLRFGMTGPPKHTYQTPFNSRGMTGRPGQVPRYVTISLMSGSLYLGCCFAIQPSLRVFQIFQFRHRLWWTSFLPKRFLVCESFNVGIEEKY